MHQNEQSKVEADRQMLINAQSKGTGATIFAYMKLSGPGWLQSAITLGGGSLAGSLYLGVIGGFALLWLQPVFMVLGIIMLSAIGYITMSTDERPFHAINRHVNPVLGWSWAAACLMANMVWCLPQFSLGNSVMEQNLFPQLYSADGLGNFNGKLVYATVVLVITVLITWSYGSGHWGIKLYEIMLKLMVGLIVICFVWVVCALSFSGQLNWGDVFWGFLPNPGSIFEPASGFQSFLNDVASESRDYWSNVIVARQKDIMATAAATAVGINMTFLFPYSILRKGWTKEFRGLQVFDLATGMFIPFVLATSCVVISAATQFHAKPVPGLIREDTTADQSPTGKELADYRGLMSKRLEKSLGAEAYQQLTSGQTEFDKLAVSQPELVAAMTAGDKSALQLQLGAAALHQQLEGMPKSERLIAAMLVERDANRLSNAIAQVGASDAASGNGFSKLLFGVGVIGMTLSTITLLMLISGFVICEVFNLPQEGWPFRLACLPAAVGALGPFIWSKAGFALAVPTSIFGLMLLPIAYLTFWALFNQKSLMKKEMPTGTRRIVWNLLMAVAASVATLASFYMVWTKVKEKGMIAIGVLLGAALVVHIYQRVKRGQSV